MGCPLTYQYFNRAKFVDNTATIRRVACYYLFCKEGGRRGGAEQLQP